MAGGLAHLFLPPHPKGNWGGGRGTTTDLWPWEGSPGYGVTASARRGRKARPGSQARPLGLHPPHMGTSVGWGEGGRGRGTQGLAAAAPAGFGKKADWGLAGMAGAWPRPRPRPQDAPPPPRQAGRPSGPRPSPPHPPKGGLPAATARFPAGQTDVCETRTRPSGPARPWAFEGCVGRAEGSAPKVSQARQARPPGRRGSGLKLPVLLLLLVAAAPTLPTLLLRRFI